MTVTPPQPPPSPQETREFTCPNCGAQTTYAAGTESLTCPHCGTVTRIAEAHKAIVEHSYDDWASVPAKPVATIGKQVLQCQNCGATVETDRLADLCRFCRGPLVALQEPPGVIVPEAVVPFGIDRDGAVQAFTTWLHSRRFAPNALKRIGRTDTLAGTYVPHWTFDAQSETDYSGHRGEYYYVTVMVPVSDGKGGTRMQPQQERRTRWYDAAGHVSHAFDDVLITASHVVAEDRLAKMGPWSLASAQPFAPEYLAGYAALRYDVDPDTGLEAAHTEMAKSIERDCRADIGGDEQRVDQVDIHYSHTMFKLMLLPLWIASYLFAGQPYQVLVNANTGEVLGDRPYSKVKIAAAIVACLLVAAGIITWIVLARR